MAPVLLVLGIALTTLHGVPLRVVTFNIEANRSGGDVTESLNEPGTNDYNTVRDILARINADVVCLQEIANADIAGGTNGGTNSDVHSLAAELGLPHVLIPTSSGVFDFSLRNVVLSRHPFLDSDEIGTTNYQDSIGAVGSNGNRAREITRAMPAVVIDVPEATNPVTLINLHNKSGTLLSDRFRRAIELSRVEDYLDRNNLVALDNIIVTGDFNLSSQTTSFSNEPNGLPGSWNRGIDIALPITYSTDPDFYFPTPYDLAAIDARDLNGGDATFQFGGATLDFFLPSPALNVTGSEIYRSELDTTNTTGLPKTGLPLNNTASSEASDHWAVFTDFEIPDQATRYFLTDDIPSVRETFGDFAGAAAPPLWRATTSGWLGLYSGQATPANYAADTNGNRSVATVAPGSGVTFSALFENSSHNRIEALEISYLARQLSARDPGTNDHFTVALTVDGVAPIPLTDLTFEANSTNTLPRAETLSTTIEDLDIPPAANFTLSLTANRGPEVGEPVSTEIFLNEFHYDNSGTDSGEFVEIVVAPGFSPSGGDLAQVAVILYNGNPNQLAPYGTFPLSKFDNFSTPTVENGYRIYSRALSLQNGPDAIAILVDGVVTQFLSYEGTFTAASGPATGLTTTDIGVTQNPVSQEGVAAIGLTGAGDGSAALTWTRFGETTPHSPGEINEGQAFTGDQPAPSQALSFDDVTVTIVTSLDNDGDGDPDRTDPDDDNDQLPDLIELAIGTNPLERDSDGDGLSDAEEDSDGDGQNNLAELTITLTDPADTSSQFAAPLSPHPSEPDNLALTFPTLTGRTYQVMSGSDPSDLRSLLSFIGTGDEHLFTIIPDQNQATFYSVQVTLSEE